MPDTSDPTRVKGHCPKCGPDRWGVVRAQFQEHESEGHVWSTTEHYVLQCPACDTVYHQTDMIFSESISPGFDEETGREVWEYDHIIKHWPAPIRRERPSWLEKLLAIDGELYRIMSEVYQALDGELYTLAAVGVRTAFDRGTELLGVDPAKRFEEKLNDIVTLGSVGAAERSALDVMADGGSASAHRGWQPTNSELETMLQIVETFVHRNFALRDNINDLTNAIPARQRRRPPPPAQGN